MTKNGDYESWWLSRPLVWLTKSKIWHLVSQISGWGIVPTHKTNAMFQSPVYVTMRYKHNVLVTMRYKHNVLR